MRILCTNENSSMNFTSLSHKVTFKNENLGNRVGKKKKKSHHWLPIKATTQNTSHSFFAFFQVSSSQNC